MTLVVPIYALLVRSARRAMIPTSSHRRLSVLAVPVTNEPPRIVLFTRAGFAPQTGDVRTEESVIHSGTVSFPKLGVTVPVAFVAKTAALKGAHDLLSAAPNDPNVKASGLAVNEPLPVMESPASEEPAIPVYVASMRTFPTSAY